jgi:hypothetical protein
MKTAIYNKVLSAVADITEVAPSAIVSHSKSAEIVEARSLLIYYLYREGLSPIQIATLSGFTRQCIEASRLRFPDKDSRSRWLTNLMQHIDGLLAT